jgi:phosphoglycolate phosphatase
MLLAAAPPQLFRPLAGVTVAFDLDGTLVDTAPDLLRCLNLTLAQLAIPEVSDDRLRGLVGHGARALIERGAALSGHQLAPEVLASAVTHFIRIYGEDIARLSLPFPGTVEALDLLEHLGARLCVCTNKPTRLALQLLVALSLAERFAAIVGPDAVAARKPAPDHLRTAVLLAGGDPERAVMVGDSSSDHGTAHTLGVPAILVSYGYPDVPLSELGSVIVTAAADLPDAVLSVCARQEVVA